MGKRLLPLNIQFFAEAGGSEPQPEGAQQNAQQSVQQNTAPAFDYEKLASIINGKQSVTEDTILKNYFKQQGMSQEEMTQAISEFKKQKAESTPDVASMQTELAQAQKMAQEAVLDKAATMAALTLGLDTKTIPYVIKLADLSNAFDASGKVNEENVVAALNKVLEDVPNLKPAAEESKGFKVGVSPEQSIGNTVGANVNTATKRWNRFN